MVGDIGEATYEWSNDISLEFLAGLGFGYFHGKCVASEVGRRFVDWDGAIAKAYVADRIGRQMALTHNTLLITEVGTNGTKLNNEQVPPGEPRKLTGGEVVKFGGMECRYDSEGKRPGSKPLPPVKAGVDFKNTATRPSTIFQNVSPFKKKVDKSSRVIQVIIVVLAVGALGCFGFLLWKFIQQH